MVEISADSRKRISARQLGGSVRLSLAACSGLSASSPGSAGISNSASSAAQAGWVKSPVPMTDSPFRAAHQARFPISASLLHARENREWTCRSAWNTPPDPATWCRQRAGIPVWRGGHIYRRPAQPQQTAYSQRPATHGWVSVSAEQAGMSNNDKYSRGRAKEEAPGCLLI